MAVAVSELMYSILPSLHIGTAKLFWRAFSNALRAARFLVVDQMYQILSIPASSAFYIFSMGLASDQRDSFTEAESGKYSINSGSNIIKFIPFLYLEAYFTFIMQLKNGPFHVLVRNYFSLLSHGFYALTEIL